ncbi:MAG: glycosyltransferase, partial [Candidatus Muiribacteriota bacterium]
MSYVVVSGGGTGGHSCAGAAFCEIIKENKPDSRIIYIGSEQGIEKEIIKELDFVEYFPVSTGKFRRKFSFKNFVDFFKVLKGVSQSRKLLYKYNPEVIISTGGYVCLPVVLASFFTGTSLVAHEQTTVPGLSNKIAFKMAENILLSFDIKLKKKTANIHISGNPVRERVKKHYYKALQQDKKKDGEPVLFITGG